MTTRGAIPYSMDVNGLHEDYPTDGSPRTFYTVARVRADLAQDFRESMLPDVDGATLTTTPGQTLLLDAWDTESTAPTHTRKALNRNLPEQHPEHGNAWCSRLTFLRGEGVPVKSDTNWIGFQQVVSNATQPGYVTFGVTFQDLPYPVTLGNTKVLAGGRVVPDEDADNTEINGIIGSELRRYCWVRPMSKTTALQVKGNFFYYLNDDGTPLLHVGNKFNDGTDPKAVITPIVGDNAAPTIPFGLTGLQCTWYMIPRIPRGVWSLRNMANKLANIAFDPTVIPDGANPEVGTLFYVGPDGPAKPYFTVSDQVVYDVTLNFLYRRGARGPTEQTRGHNALFCPLVREFRRVVAAQQGSTARTFDTTGAEAEMANLPSNANEIVSGSNPGRRIYDFGDLINIWRFV